MFFWALLSDQDWWVLNGWVGGAKVAYIRSVDWWVVLQAFIGSMVVTLLPTEGPSNSTTTTTEH